MRIGELSRRIGESPSTLRAWERRYGVTTPLRTEGGYRLYSARDEALLRELKRLRDEGLPVAEAAKLAREDPLFAGQAGYGTANAEQAAPTQAGARVAGRAALSERDAGAYASASLRDPGGQRVQELARAIEDLDGPRVTGILDCESDRLPLASFVEGLIFPVLRDLGERWSTGEDIVGREHFASNLIRGRLLTLAQDWGSGTAPLAVLACPPGEQHDIGLIAFGLLLREQGWRIISFGQNTPVELLADCAADFDAQAVVVSGVDARRLRTSQFGLAEVARDHPLFLGGAAASHRFARRVGATVLEGEPSYAAAVLGARARVQPN